MDLGKNLNLEKERIQSELNSKQSEINKLYQENGSLKRKLNRKSVNKQYKLKNDKNSIDNDKMDKSDSGRESDNEVNHVEVGSSQKEVPPRYTERDNNAQIELPSEDTNPIEDQENPVQTVTCYISCYL